MNRLAVLLLGICIGATIPVCITHAQKNGLFPGMEPYTPTRLEWLTLDLEATYRTELSSDSYYSLDFVAEAPDTVKVVIQYTDKASAGIIDRAIENARDFVKKDALGNGWSKWVKIKVDRSRIE